MENISLQTSVVSNPDLSGFNFYVEEGRTFEVTDYAEAYGIRVDEIDEQSWKAAQDAASRLNAGEWLHVSHDA